MLTWADEGRVIERAVQEMRTQRVPVTPEHVEMALNACRGGGGGPTPPRPSGTLGAGVERLEQQVEHLATAVARLRGAEDPLHGREVVGMFLDPSGAEIKVVREGPPDGPKFLEPVPYFARNDQGRRPTEAEQLKAEAQGWQAYVDRHGTPDFERERARRRLAEIQRRLDDIRHEQQPEAYVDRSGARMRRG